MVDSIILAGLDLGYLTRLLVAARAHAGAGEVTAAEGGGTEHPGRLQEEDGRRKDAG